MKQHERELIQNQSINPAPAKKAKLVPNLGPAQAAKPTMTALDRIRAMFAGSDAKPDVQQIKNNLPLRWCSNSCFIDTFFVAMMYDRASPYFKFIKRQLETLAYFMEKPDFLTPGAPPTCMMNHIEVFNTHYLPPRAPKYQRGATGSIGLLEKTVTHNKLEPFVYNDVASFLPACVCNPFMIRQFIAQRPPTAESLLRPDFGGVDVPPNQFQIHAISGLAHNHYQTLVRGANNIFYKVNISPSQTTDVVPYTVEQFAREFVQLRVYYVNTNANIANGADCGMTLERHSACDRVAKLHIVKLLKMLTVAGHSYPRQADVRSILPIIEGNMDYMTVKGVYDIAKSHLSALQQAKYVKQYLNV
jgi:hypothetical protein